MIPDLLKWVEICNQNLDLHVPLQVTMSFESKQPPNSQFTVCL